MSKKLKMFIRYAGDGRIVSGSNIFATEKPKTGKWMEINSSLCCIPTTSTTSSTSTTTTPLPTLGYGLLYNWFAATDVNLSSSNDWIVPSEPEFRILLNSLGTETGGFYWFLVGGYLKEIGISYWNSPNTGASNSTNFNAKGAGYRAGLDFASIKATTCMWSRTLDPTNPWYLQAFYNTNSAHLDTSNHYSGSGVNIPRKAVGRSIRLLKSSTSLTNGQTGTYIGNDGKIYRTICIGTQEWLADNLKETKYRNGNDIIEVIDPTAWYSLITGALCAYDNDWNNV